jgi:predicted RNase H-related nuclease YkuK (DUF458 family)
MPIQINLLAEQQEAEEARRRDPVKRAIWAGASVVGLSVLYCVWLQFQLGVAQASLANDLIRQQKIEADAKSVRADRLRISEIDARKVKLLSYATNRFYWASALDALQRTSVEGVQVITLEGTHSYSTNAESKFRTNIVVTRPSTSAWRFWEAKTGTNIHDVVARQLSLITNRAEYATNRIRPIVKITVDTNQTKITAALELVRPAAAIEKIVLTIDARDYSDVPGKRVDDFLKAIAGNPYFKERLEIADGQGVRLKERAIQPDSDPLDPLHPGKPFIPFKVECRFKERIQANE